MSNEHQITQASGGRLMNGRRASRSALVVATSSLALLAGCGDDSPRPSAAAVTLEMSEFAIDIPEVVPSGLVEVRGLNDGEILHQAVFAELPDGLSADAYVERLLDDLGDAVTEADLRGGVNLVLPASEQTATLELQPGNYVVVCSLPGPKAGESHLSNGMWADFTVQGTTSDAPSQLARLPSDGEIDLIDWAFDMPDTIRSGDDYTVVNSGTQVHEIGMAELADGATRDDVLAFFTGEGPEGAPPPFENLSGIGWLSPGQAQSFPIEVPPGRYVFVCYVPDPNDGVPHFMKGMIKVVEVV